MIERVRRKPAPGRGGDAASPTGPETAWTPEKMRVVLEALRSFVSNQATKHGIPAHEVWALVRDEVLDPGGPMIAAIAAVPALIFAQGPASPGEFLLTLVFLAVIIVVSLVSAAMRGPAHYHVSIKGGLPHCGRCGRQVSYRRDVCRACAYTFKTYGGGHQAPARAAAAPAAPPPASPPPASRPAPPPRPPSRWEGLRGDPADPTASRSLLLSVEWELAGRLLGPKKVVAAVSEGAVKLVRTRLQYEATVTLAVLGDRHGFEVRVPTHGFRLRITCPRVVPEEDAPWDDLLENLCKIDRSIISSRNSKSQPLTYAPGQGRHPGLRVEVLERPSRRQPPGLPGG